MYIQNNCFHLLLTTAFKRSVARSLLFIDTIYKADFSICENKTLYLSLNGC